jgi:hypothetical protein
MNIKKYINLIDKLPHLEQTYIPNESRWEDILNKRNIKLSPDWINGFSRDKLLKLSFSKEKIIKIFMWGYPRGGRGNNINEVLKKIINIETVLSKYKGNKIDKDHLLTLLKEINNFKYLGRSTWSKLLYFSNIFYQNNRLLILDNKIKNVISDSNINGVACNKIGNDIYSYISYVESMNELGKMLNIETDKIEFFLFLFSDILKLRNVV